MNDKILLTVATGKTGCAATIEWLKAGRSVEIYDYIRSACSVAVM